MRAHVHMTVVTPGFSKSSVFGVGKHRFSVDRRSNRMKNLCFKFIRISGDEVLKWFPFPETVPSHPACTALFGGRTLTSCTNASLMPLEYVPSGAETKRKGMWYQ